VAKDNFFSHTPLVCLLHHQTIEIYRVLAKNNPQAYGIDLVNSLVMGVDLFNQPIKNLDDAEDILKSFRGIPKAERLL